MQVFNALNTLELKSLEEPRYLLEQFAAHPIACLTLASFVASNTGDTARRVIKASLVCLLPCLLAAAPQLELLGVVCSRGVAEQGLVYSRGSRTGLGELRS